MPQTLAGWISSSVAAVVCLWAIWRGERPERIAAVALILATLADVLGQDRVLFIDPERRLLTIDSALFAVYACLTSMTQRRWLIVATAMQLLTLLVHVLVVWDHKVHAYAYITALAGLSYGELIALAVGVWQVQRARRAA